MNESTAAGNHLEMQEGGKLRRGKSSPRTRTGRSDTASIALTGFHYPCALRQAIGGWQD
jgi:hypothetical protein